MVCVMAKRQGEQEKTVLIEEISKEIKCHNIKTMTFLLQKELSRLSCI